MQDTIQRKIQVKATQQQIYAAIADPELVVKWFPETLEGDYQPGSQPVFGFGEGGKTQIHVEAAKPHEYFAFRWVPGSNMFIGDVRTVPHTLVEFKISAATDGACEVTLTESGFAALPAAMMADAIKQNSGGWDFMMDRLAQYFSGSS
ncbi:SRPBCC family protein [Marinicella litoralis]|uniref:Uncharacterized protein YndB with AHSA1/START domain n=1 Tax=Marinicella litoralis TaxID=644220 RepID=A0A4R6XU50_9GAMM|nr:SRPBCC family protein [Marinicella litoralis]TDR23515.1 uncharacterized protein YndB with AHSA1/START domain [Marinicella litoralis]